MKLTLECVFKSTNGDCLEFHETGQRLPAGELLQAMQNLIGHLERKHGVTAETAILYTKLYEAAQWLFKYAGLEIESVAVAQERKR